MKEMKAFRRFVLALGLASASLGVYAQSDNPYIDDAYLSPKEVELRHARAKAEAETRYREALERERRYEAERQKRLDAYKAQQRDREIDAYNGRSSNGEYYQDEQQYGQTSHSLKKGSTEVHIYGPYSERLARFHGEGTLLVTSPRVYVDRDYYSDEHTTLSLHIGNGSWYPWYDPFYLSTYPYGGHYRSRHWYRHGSYWGWHPYDPFYNPYYYDSWTWGYYGGYYGSLYGYYDGYYRGLADRAYTDHYYRNPYRHGSRSSSHQHSSRAERSAYGAYRSASSSSYERNSYGSSGYHSDSHTGGSYREVGRSYGGSTRYQGAARLPQQGRDSYSTPEGNNNSSNSYERSYSRPSTSSGTTNYSSPSPVSSPSPTSRGMGIRSRHR